MLGVLKGSILVRAILCVVHTFGNAYRCSLLEKFVSAVYRSWRGSFVHHICSKYVVQPADIESAETPPVRDFMKELQRDGTKLLADDKFTGTIRITGFFSCILLCSS